MDKSPAEFREIFKDGCHATDTSNRILQTDYSKLNGVDCGTWWMYNKLDTHIKNFCYEKGVDSSLTLPNHKGTWTPKDRELFDEYYDQKTQDAVRKYYEKDFEKMFELETGLEVA